MPRLSLSLSSFSFAVVNALGKPVLFGLFGCGEPAGGNGNGVVAKGGGVHF